MSSKTSFSVPFRRLGSSDSCSDIYEVPSSSGGSYKIYKMKDTGKYKCDCPHFIFRLAKQGTHCKHITDLIDNLNIHRVTMDFLMEKADWTCDWSDDLDQDASK